MPRKDSSSQGVNDKCGYVEIETRAEPLRGPKYQVDIAFDGKPDYVKIVKEFREQGIHRDPMPDEIWNQVLIGMGHEFLTHGLSVFRVEEPAGTHPDDRFLKAFALVDKEKYSRNHVWHRVRLYLLGDTRCRVDDLQ